MKAIVKELVKQFVDIPQRETEYKVEFEIKGSAVIRQGEDYDQVISFAVPYDKLLAVALSKLNGVTMDSIVREALDESLDVSEVKKQALASLTAIKGKSTRHCSGKLTSSNIVIDEVIDTCEFC